MKKDLSKLYFLNGTLRDNKQSDYSYLTLFKNALDNLGITYPSAPSGGDNFSNTNLTFNGDRAHELGDNTLTLKRNTSSGYPNSLVYDSPEAYYVLRSNDINSSIQTQLVYGDSSDVRYEAKSQTNSASCELIMTSFYAGQEQSYLMLRSLSPSSSFSSSFFARTDIDSTKSDAYMSALTTDGSIEKSSIVLVENTAGAQSFLSLTTKEIDGNQFQSVISLTTDYNDSNSTINILTTGTPGQTGIIIDSATDSVSFQGSLKIEDSLVYKNILDTSSGTVNIAVGYADSGKIFHDNNLPTNYVLPSAAENGQTHTFIISDITSTIQPINWVIFNGAILCNANEYLSPTTSMCSITVVFMGAWVVTSITGAWTSSP